MKNAFNDRLAAAAKKRRDKLLAEHLSGKTQQELADKYKVSRQRIQYQLAKARM